MNRPKSDVEADKLIAILKQSMAKATQVVGWYPHSKGEAYRSPNATVRGPYFRWFVVEKGDDQGNNQLADQDDDAAYCADAMNHVPDLIEIIENERAKSEKLDAAPAAKGERSE